MLGKSEALREQSIWMALVATGFGAGALAGVAAHLVGLGQWALVPIGAGIGGGVGSVATWLGVNHLHRKRQP